MATKTADSSPILGFELLLVALVGVLLLSALFAPREKQVELLLDGHGQKPSPLPMAA